MHLHAQNCKFDCYVGTMITLEIVSLRHLSQGGRCWSTGNAYYTPENLAFRKTTWQSTSHDATISGPERAVDGLKKDRSYLGRQCSVSSVHQITASWWVNLGGILSINNILIYYRTDNMPWNENNIYTTRFLGFSVYISNTTDRNGGISCFNDTNYTKFTIPDHVNISCPTYGQYVIYYNERLQGVSYPDDYYPYAFVELCEVEVYGCPIPGYYGSDCSLPCPDSNCRYCHIQSGVCVGCEFGYQGHQCEQQCNQSFYGELCSEKCGNFTDIRTCNHVNGTCTNGCDVGVYGDKCKIVCPSGLYGKNCLEKCYNCETCDRFTGRCTSPCKTGWKGFFCMEDCDGRRYGEDCGESCGACLGYKQCHHINGSCLEGCDSGYKGDLCKTACSDGTYGTNCEGNCNNNCGVPYRCNGTTGQCEGGCQDGWEGPHCQYKCTNNMYGRNCSRRCGNCRNGAQCHHINGICQNGCMQGYKDIYCTSECQAGFYGFNCTEECSLFCKTPRGCNHITGQCKEGCIGGWQGDMCLQVAKRVDVVEWQSEFHGFLAAFGSPLH